MTEDNEDDQAYPWFVAIEVVIAIVVVLISGNFASAAINGEIKIKSFIVEDFALAIESLSGTKGDSMMLYSPRGDASKYFDKYIIYIKEKVGEQYFNRVGIQRPGDPNKIFYPYSAKDNFTRYQTITTPDFILLAKNNDKLITKAIRKKDVSTSEPQYEAENIILSDVYTVTNFQVPQTKNKVKTILIDPGHGSVERMQDKGYTFVDSSGTEFIEEELTRNIAFLVIQRNDFLTTRKVEKGVTEHKSTSERIGYAKNDEVSAVVSIHVGSYPDNFDKAVAYVSSNPETVEESRRIASLVLNKIEKDNEEGYSFDYLSIEIINTDELLSEDPMLILSINKPAVFFEFGNIRYEKSVIRTTSVSKLGMSINNALGGYSK